MRRGSHQLGTARRLSWAGRILSMSGRHHVRVRVRRFQRAVANRHHAMRHDRPSPRRLLRDLRHDAGEYTCSWAHHGHHRLRQHMTQLSPCTALPHSTMGASSCRAFSAPNGPRRCAVGGNVERPRTAKKRQRPCNNLSFRFTPPHRYNAVLMIASVSGNDVYCSCFRIFTLSCRAWSALVRWRPSPWAAVVTQLVTHAAFLSGKLPGGLSLSAQPGAGASGPPV